VSDDGKATDQDVPGFGSIEGVADFSKVFERRRT